MGTSCKEKHLKMSKGFRVVRKSTETSEAYSKSKVKLGQ